ncbi:MAG TPA: hypothetical protein VFR18_20005 [Terriglobia bacterium]|nr:hypothetical protein [Terriglobia bacterium]
MKSNSKCMFVTIVFLVASLMMVGIEPAAFAAPPPDVPQAEERAAEAPKVLPDRPVIVTWTVPTHTSVAQAIQNPTQRTASASSRPAYTPPPRQNSGKSKKWIWILAAAAGAAVTVGVLASGDDPPPEATITLGTPSVGAPQ